MNYDDTRFSVMFSRYGGWRRILGSSDFVLALVLALTGTVAITYEEVGQTFVQVSFFPFLTVSAAMIATSLAGLAIISSISDEKYVRFARAAKMGQSSLYENVIFVFWFTSMVAFVSLFADIVGGLVNGLAPSQPVSDLFAFLMLFFLLYAVFSVAILLGAISRWGLYRGAYVDAGSPSPPSSGAKESTKTEGAKDVGLRQP